MGLNDLPLGIIRDHGQPILAADAPETRLMTALPGTARTEVSWGCSRIYQIPI